MKQVRTQKKHIHAHVSTEWVFRFWAWQLLFWALYRYFFHLPEWADEFVFKPLVFVVPVFLYVLKKERSRLISIGLTKKNLSKNLLFGMGMGIIFFLEGIGVNIATNGTLKIQQLSTVAGYSVGLLTLLSLATAFSEEVLSRGFLFSRLYAQTKRLWYSILLSTAMFVAFHIPILVTSLKFQGPTLILFVATSVVLAIVNSIIFVQSKSLVTPILIHFFWNMTVALFL
ncbi:MAG: CPBP family intramembrane glutamic endopeptidase [Microgenomates group bacterium]